MQGREEDYMRETKGININGNVRPAFEVGILQDLFKAPTVDIPFSKLVFTTADPNAGGARSKFAISSAVYLEDGTMVVSILFF
jgi:hypothetical protein